MWIDGGKKGQKDRQTDRQERSQKSSLTIHNVQRVTVLATVRMQLTAQTKAEIHVLYLSRYVCVQ